MAMIAEIKARWTAALRSGEWEQGHGSLNEHGKLCCLGVLCEEAVKDGVITADSVIRREFYTSYAGATDVLPRQVREWAGLPGADGEHNPNNPVVTVDGKVVSLAELNDGENGWEPHTFEQIADIIDAQL